MAPDLSLAEARRLALASQGFAEARPDEPGLDHVRNVIRRLGLVQLDYVNVLLPAHYLVFYSRLGSYRRDHFEELVYQRREFTEHWAHEASVIPMESWPLLAYRRAQHRARPYGFQEFLDQHPEYALAALEHLRMRGALTPADLPDPQNRSRKLAESWFGTVPRAVLEAHFGRGHVSIANRLPNFTRVYDLSERVIPGEHLEHRVEVEEAQRRLLLMAAKAHGVAAAGDLADYFRMPVTEAKPRLLELVEAGLLEQVRVEGWRDAAYFYPGSRIPREVRASALLCPFDPVIWTRQRTERLFGFEYRFEIFVPQEKRRWGSYVLPFLLGDRLVARVDLKAERLDGRLAVLGSYLEPGVEAGEVAEALARELTALARWMGLNKVRVARRGDFAKPLAAAVRRGTFTSVHRGTEE
ncbi:MAG: YcaQ family DNA glycosylase [Acidobacteria bacterium]|nr:YcaQ family DNA glycosylase [Acidobacteriota bacterium]